MAGGLLEVAGAMQDRAALWVVGSPDHPPDAGMADRTGAHGTGFKRHIKSQVG